MDNLLLAFYKSKRRKEDKGYVKSYKKNLHENIEKLRQSLLDGTVTLSPYSMFYVFVPKKRLICAAQFQDRVLHHAIMNVCEQRFEQNMIDQTCACRKSKGVDYALKLAKSYNFKWYLKLDVVKYFDSINHSLMIKIIERLFKEYPLIELFWKIITSYETRKNTGLPIGNLTSQFNANIFFSILDHLIKEVFKIVGYVRYMDDMILLDDSKERLKETYKRILDFCETKMLLHLHEPILNQCKYGFPFLGYKINHWNMRLTARSKKRFRDKYKFAVRCINNGIWSEREFEMHTEPLLAFLHRAETENLIQSILG